MTAPAPDGTTPRPGRGLRIALAVSLAANLLVVGLVVGLVFAVGNRRAPEPDGPPALRSLGLGPMVFALSREDRDALRERIDARRDDLRGDSGGLARAVLAFTAALRSDTFDREAAAASLAEQREFGMGLQERGHEVLLDQLEAMSPEARDELADRIERGLRRHLPDPRGTPDR
ncbi:periplasmic heavy metal sensor [Rhodobacterales bacterium HKCCE2091]|nr:periplasmic heavy metal sensor [Rhodobacterales bacterium HKCCE2091]